MKFFNIIQFSNQIGKCPTKSNVSASKKKLCKITGIHCSLTSIQSYVTRVFVVLTPSMVNTKKVYMRVIKPHAKNIFITNIHGVIQQQPQSYIIPKANMQIQTDHA